MAGTNYINGSDLLLKVGGKAVGHCTSHTLTFESETKDRAVKPVAEAPVSAGLWKGKGVTGLSISVSAEGLRFYEETENGYEEISALWGKGQSVDVEAFPRGGDGTPYLKGRFVITSLEETSPAQDDSTYTVELENDGEPEVYPGKAGAKSYGKVSVELSYPTIPAAGGKAGPTLSYSQEWGWNGSTSGGGTATSGGRATYGGAGVDAATGEVTAEANEGEARDVASATVEVVLNGKTGTAAATVRQEGA